MRDQQADPLGLVSVPGAAFGPMRAIGRRIAGAPPWGSPTRSSTFGVGLGVVTPPNF